MKAPDGREFAPPRKGGAVSATVRAALAGLRALGRFGFFLLGGAGKIVATIWRLAGALDAALWRGVKLFVRSTARSVAAIALVAALAVDDLLQWLPSRWGRAYSAFSGLVLIVAALWIVDELRVDPASLDRGAEAGRAPVDLEDPILARVEGRYVHLSEVVADARASGAIEPGETLTPKAAFDRELVQAHVERRLLARAATEEGVSRLPHVARQLAAARERILAAAYLEARVASEVTDEAVERLYSAQSDITRLGDEVRARQIVVESGERAEELVAELAAGASFSQLVLLHSSDRATAGVGGDLGWFTKDMMAPALAAAAFSTPVGEIATPFQTEFGWHVLEVTDRRRSAGVPLEAIRDDIRRFLTLRAISGALDELRQASEVVYYPPEQTQARASPPGGAAAER